MLHFNGHFPDKPGLAGCLLKIWGFYWRDALSLTQQRQFTEGLVVCIPLRMTEQPPLTAIVQKRRLMLFGHLARMDETADARRILTDVHQSDWSRPVGRPCTYWMATLKSDLSLHNLTFEDAIELALDKSLWRLLVASRATH